MLSSRSQDLDAGLVVALQEPEQLPGDDPLEAALDVSRALALGGSAGGVGASLGVITQPDQRDGVQGLVELAVAAAVDSLGRLGCQTGAWLLLTMMGGASRLAVGKVASCPASRCDLPCALSAL